MSPLVYIGLAGGALYLYSRRNKTTFPSAVTTPTTPAPKVTRIHIDELLASGRGDAGLLVKFENAGDKYEVEGVHPDWGYSWNYAGNWDAAQVGWPSPEVVGQTRIRHSLDRDTGLLTIEAIDITPHADFKHAELWAQSLTGPDVKPGERHLSLLRWDTGTFIPTPKKPADYPAGAPWPPPPDGSRPPGSPSTPYLPSTPPPGWFGQPWPPTIPGVPTGAP